MAVTVARLGRGLWIAGVVALALSVGLGSRVAQEHLAARRAWLSASADVTAEGYDATRSDAIYARSADALESLSTWATVGGVGLLALALGLGLRRGPPAAARRRWLRGAVALAAGLLVYAALLGLSGAVRHDLLGPALATVCRATAPFAGLSAAATIWLSRRGAGRATTAGSA